MGDCVALAKFNFEELLLIKSNADVRPSIGYTIRGRCFVYRDYEQVRKSTSAIRVLPRRVNSSCWQDISSIFVDKLFVHLESNI